MAKGKKRISIHNLAAELNLSASTISRALNNASDVSESTKAQVWALVEKLNYQPNPLAAALRRGRTTVLSVCFRGRPRSQHFRGHRVAFQPVPSGPVGQQQDPPGHRRHHDRA